MTSDLICKWPSQSILKSLRRWTLPGIQLDDSCGPLPTQGILWWFEDSPSDSGPVTNIPYFFSLWLTGCTWTVIEVWMHVITKSECLSLELIKDSHLFEMTSNPHQQYPTAYAECLHPLWLWAELCCIIPHLQQIQTTVTAQLAHSSLQKHGNLFVSLSYNSEIVQMQTCSLHSS